LLKYIGYVWMEGFGGEDLYFSFKLRTLQNGFSTQLSVIEVLYDHLSCCSLNFFKISNICKNIDLSLQTPPKQTLSVFEKGD
jgi:hypothetical protein